jgi:nucleoside-diphosphate-sugar epimerase
MKRILITGQNSYVGSNIEEYLGIYPNSYSINTISLRNDSWKENDFSKYDVVIHVAGVAHIKETKENAHLYYEVNRDLAYEVAKKSKVENVKQFIFLSSMSVYGIDSGVIDENSPTEPKGNYGKSKLQAEKLITTLEDDVFKIVILRPPMIYGKECKGNYNRLSNLAVKIPIFPNIKNKRSMIFIDNLSEFVKCVIDNDDRGILYPQNNDYVETTKMVELIAKAHGKKLYKTRLFNPLIDLMRNNQTVNKVFGNLVYDKEFSKYNNCQLNKFVGFEKSIRVTEE